MGTNKIVSDRSRWLDPIAKIAGFGDRGMLRIKLRRNLIEFLNYCCLAIVLDPSEYQLFHWM
jgi:hypothetical protein